MERKHSTDKEATPLNMDDGEADLSFTTKKVHATEVEPISRARRWWIGITWFLTWWIPSFLLRKLGGMERADVRQAWREKLAIFMMVFLLCGIIIFYIIVFGRLLCPNSDKAWNMSELATHQGDDDFMAAIRGKVYDVSLPSLPPPPLLDLSRRGPSIILILLNSADLPPSSRNSTRASTRTSRHTQPHPTSCSSSPARISQTTFHNQ